MKSVHKTVLIWHSAPEMFALVADVARYPEFLPWCSEGAVLQEQDEVMVARVGMSISGIRKSFTTRNTHDGQRSIRLELVDGPFSQLDGHWEFIPLGGPGQKACKIVFTLNYAFSSRTLEALVGPVFDKIAGSLVDAFVKRADQVYGEG
jgi:ribosome-associated toxin RatA of RatAB toxin-antitoxin module